VRLYSVAVASVAIGAPEKWTDNLLAHHELPGVQSKARGVARGISWPALVHLGLVRELHVRIGCSVRNAVAFAAALLASPADLIVPGPYLSITFERAQFERDLHHRLADALEIAPRPRRGRPRRRGWSGSDVS
jgi:hypothetical protein